MAEDERSEEEKAADFNALSEDLRRASLDLREAINELSADYASLGKAPNSLVWLRAIDRCERDAANISAKFGALKVAILSEPFKP